MLTLESGLIGKNGKLECKYYELERKCIEIVENYCIESEENNQIFEQFSKNYKLFRPYFDFVVCVLGYMVINPEMETDTILVGRDNHMYKYKNGEELGSPKAFCYGLSDNVTLNVYPMTLDSGTYHDCLVDGDCNHILPKDMFGHVHIFQQILNMILISNKEICEEYLRYNSDIGMFVQRYYPLLRFQADRQGHMIVVRSMHRTDNITKKQKVFINDLLANRFTYPFYLSDLCSVDKDSYVCDISNSLKYNDDKRIKKFK